MGWWKRDCSFQAARVYTTFIGVTRSLLHAFIFCLNEVAWGTPRRERMQAREWILVESKGVERLTRDKKTEVKFIRGVGRRGGGAGS